MDNAEEQGKEDTAGVDPSAAVPAPGPPARLRGRIPPDAPERRDRYLRDRLAPILERALGGELCRLPVEDRSHPLLSFHACPLDPECRSLGAPPRLHVGFPPGWFLTVALAPSGRLQSGRLWGTVLLEPRSSHRCENVVALVVGEDGLLESYRTCPLRRRHRGGCLDWASQRRVLSASTVSP